MLLPFIRYSRNRIRCQKKVLYYDHGPRLLHRHNVLSTYSKAMNANFGSRLRPDKIKYKLFCYYVKVFQAKVIQICVTYAWKSFTKKSSNLFLDYIFTLNDYDIIDTQWGPFNGCE